MAGYFGYSKSNNAIQAESEGLWPLTHAIHEVAEQAGCTRDAARIALTTIGACEWHHTSKKYNRTDYYCVADAVEFAVKYAAKIERTIRLRKYAAKMVKAAGGRYWVRCRAASGEIMEWFDVDARAAKRADADTVSRMIESETRGFAEPRWVEAEVEAILAAAGL